ncbi:MAG: phage tail protein [Methylovulum sp.]|uniref:phage tail protein n=1 Tax=Methylovulum sp. TaxID=1916980 RepID=UPI0026022A66|nr:phage tail protein [Methylovulum sp.]MDD2725409.1 phage tail protein [Methylovulum sp.]
MDGGGGGGYDAPKLSAIAVQSIGYGTPVQVLMGTDRVSPILGWTANFRRVEKDSGGGKGMGGSGGKQTVYYADVLMFVCEGPIRGFGRVWRDKKKHDTLAKAGFSFSNTGLRPQAAWGNLTVNFPAQALAYSGTALVAASSYELSDGATLGNHAIETFGLLTSAGPAAQNHLDAHIQDVISEFLTNPYWGAISSQSAQIMLDTAHCHDYCRARGLLVSPLLSSVRPAHEYLAEWAQIANAGIVWSEGVLKFRPYADHAFSGDFGSYAPDTQIRRHFDADDGAVYEHIEPTRKKPQDCYNSVAVKYLNRAREYNESIIKKDDLAAIDADGLRPAEDIELECIKLANVAAIVAYTQLQRYLYIRNQYRITTDCDADLLEPVDFITVSSAGLGLVNHRCRIVSIDDNQNGSLTLSVEDAPIGAYSG